MTKKYRYSEIFLSFQGEGHYTGIPTVWYRAWGCNFECRGFFQTNLDTPETWELDYQNIDINQYKTLEELPVFNQGCDSSYSWSKKFAQLAHNDTVEEITTKIRGLLPNGRFKHPKSKQSYHMAFTGGEPMLSQSAIRDILGQFQIENDYPEFITIETNGTQPIRQDFIDYIESKTELFWSVSPKLYLSGEKWDDAIKPEIVAGYYKASNTGQLKYVCNGTERNWDEVERATDLYRKAGIDWPIWIMPVGATKEEQEEVQANIVNQAIQRGYNVAARVHVFVYGNRIGT
jgi:organic radical activating enzyme